MYEAYINNNILYKITYKQKQRLSSVVAAVKSYANCMQILILSGMHIHWKGSDNFDLNLQNNTRLI